MIGFRIGSYVDIPYYGCGKAGVSINNTEVSVALASDAPGYLCNRDIFVTLLQQAKA